MADFYPRPLRGGRPTSVGCVMFWFLFLSTPSARRATSIRPHGQRVDAISIHALCEEGDWDCYRFPRFLRDFYPRPLRGGRPSGMIIPINRDSFLSTPSARRATLGTIHAGIQCFDFYPRPLRGGRPRSFSRGRIGIQDFYPRPLRGGRRTVSAVYRTLYEFLSTPSARRATRAAKWCAIIYGFLSTPSARRAT